MRKKIGLLIITLSLILSVGLIGCNKGDNSSSNEKEIKVSIAASLQKPMEEIANEFTKETGIKVQ